MLKLADKTLEDSNVSRIYPRRGLEQAFLKAFEDMGGTEKLQDWGSRPENYLEFLKLLTKFAPKVEEDTRSAAVLEYRSNIPSSSLNRPKKPQPTRAELLAQIDQGVEDGDFVEMGDQP